MAVETNTSVHVVRYPHSWGCVCADSDDENEDPFSLASDEFPVFGINDELGLFLDEGLIKDNKLFKHHQMLQ